MSHEEFKSRYQLVLGRLRCERMKPLVICQRIIESCHLGVEIRVGKNLVYATEHGIELAERWKDRTRQISASIIQRWWKRNMERKQAAKMIQRWWRARRRMLAASKVQNWWRKKLANKKLLMNLNRLLAASKVQIWWRGRLAKKRLLVNLSRFVKSARLVKRVVHQWVRAKKLAKHIKQIQNNNVKQAQNNNVKPVSPVELSSTDSSSSQSSQSSQPAVETINKRLNEFHLQTSELSFSLPRSNLFYKDGVVSIRRPFPVNFFEV